MAAARVEATDTHGASQGTQRGLSSRAGAAGSTTREDDPQALVATFAFDSGDEGGPYDAVLRVTGRRVGVIGIPRAGDSFSRDERVEGVVPGTGPVSVTVTVPGIAEGAWTVDARLVHGKQSGAPAGRPGQVRAQPVDQVQWSWRRWRLAPAPTEPVRTRWALLAALTPQPAVMPGIYTAFAIIGFVIALATQAVILGRDGLDIGPPLTASIIALLAGLIGAKLWFRILNPDKAWFVGGGWAVDGFLVVFPLVGAFTLLAWDQPVGQVFDASTPGIFLAVALGRLGCFFTGCCAGRCTAGRLGVWSSDRRVGARRVPTQLLESVAGLALGVVALVVVLGGGVGVPGAIFVAAFAIYAAVRQVLLRLRVERRRSARTVPLTAVAAGAVAIVVAVIALAQGA